jgi:pimeloyl-ACP methyl ester carboxylesterase
MFALLLARDHPASVGRLVLVGAYAGWGGSLDADALAQRIAAARFTMEHPAEEWAGDFLDSVFAPDAPPERRAHAAASSTTPTPDTTAPGPCPLAFDRRGSVPFVICGTCWMRQQRWNPTGMSGHYEVWAE